MRQTVPYFLTITKLLPYIRVARRLCKFGRVVVGGQIATTNTFIKPFDIINFTFPKKFIFFKQKKIQYRNKRRKYLRLARGLLYNKRIKSYIYYKNPETLPIRPKPTYLYYYYYHRNLLQRCRTH